LPGQEKRRFIEYFKVKVHIQEAPLIEYFGLDMKPSNVLPQLGNKSEHKIFMICKLRLGNNGYIGLVLVQYGYEVLGG